MEAVAPVDSARVREFLGDPESSQMHLDFQDYRDDELAYPTESAVIFVNMSAKNILQIRGQWRARASDDESFSELMRLIHLCNMQRSGPKAYILPSDDRTTFGVGAECNLIVSKGANKEQLVHFYETSLTMIVGFFRELEEALPHLVTWKDAP